MVAPTLGAGLTLAWAPVVGPTLGAVMALGVGGSNDARGGVLAVAYCLGAELPFIAGALAFAALSPFVVWRRRYRAVLVTGGAAITTALGVLLISGAWVDVVSPVEVWVNGFTPLL